VHHTAKKHHAAKKQHTKGRAGKKSVARRGSRTARRVSRTSAAYTVAPVAATIGALTASRKRQLSLLVGLLVVLAVILLALYFTCNLPGKPASCSVTASASAGAGSSTAASGTNAASAGAGSSTAASGTNAGAIIGGVLGLLFVIFIVGLVMGWWKRLFGSRDTERTLEEDELVAELNSKISVKDAPKFYELAFGLYMAASADKNLSTEEKNKIYKQLLDISRSGGAAEFKTFDSLAEIVSPGVIMEAKAAAESAEITGEKGIENLRPDELDKKLAKVKGEDAYKNRVRELVKKAIDGIKAVRDARGKPLSTVEQEILDRAEQDNLSTRQKKIITWEGLASMPKAIASLRTASKNGTIFERQANYIFRGPPGLGKTAAIDAMINADDNLIVLRADPSILGSNRGESAKELMFRYAVLKRLKFVADNETDPKSRKRAVLFVDEADMVLRDPEFRNQLQIMMNDPDVSVVLATNYYNLIAEPIKDRASDVVFKSTGIAGRKDVIKAEMGKLRFKSSEDVPARLASMLDDKDISDLARFKISSRQITAAFESAFVKAKDRALEAAKKAKTNASAVLVTKDDIMNEIKERYYKRSRVDRLKDVFSLDR
jgi:DNA polymerase III delta prime subunit